MDRKMSTTGSCLSLTGKLDLLPKTVDSGMSSFCIAKVNCPTRRRMGSFALSHGLDWPARSSENQGRSAAVNIEVSGQISQGIAPRNRTFCNRQEGHNLSARELQLPRASSMCECRGAPSNLQEILMLRCLASLHLASRKSHRIRRTSVIQQSCSYDVDHLRQFLRRQRALPLSRLPRRLPEALEALARAADEVGVGGLPPKRKTTTATRGKHDSSNGTECSDTQKARAHEGVTI